MILWKNIELGESCIIGENRLQQLGINVLAFVPKDSFHPRLELGYCYVNLFVHSAIR